MLWVIFMGDGGGTMRGHVPIVEKAKIVGLRLSRFIRTNYHTN